MKTPGQKLTRKPTLARNPTCMGPWKVPPTVQSNDRVAGAPNAAGWVGQCANFMEPGGLSIWRVAAVHQVP